MTSGLLQKFIMDRVFSNPVRGQQDFTRRGVNRGFRRGFRRGRSGARRYGDGEPRQRFRQAVTGNSSDFTDTDFPDRLSVMLELKKAVGGERVGKTLMSMDENVSTQAIFNQNRTPEHTQNKAKTHHERNFFKSLDLVSTV